jgi:raffinose/stachyose/melibiose transport system permease protein
MVHRRRETIVSYGILAVFALIAIVPLLGVLSIALAPPGDQNPSFSLPTSFHWENFARAWSIGYFSLFMRSSVIVAFAVVVLVLPLSVAAGYAFGTMSFPGRDVIFYILLSGLVVPFEAAIIPLYYDMRSLQLDDTYYSLVLPQVGLAMSFGTFWMRSFFRSVPRSLLESAWIDGAHSWTVLRSVLLPMARPALLTQAVLAFMWSWNEFLLPLVMVSSNDMQTAPLGLSYFIQARTTDETGLAAAAVLVALPVVVVYLFLQRSFIRGMLSGAIKE